jgi:hypothetical protein
VKRCNESCSFERSMRQAQEARAVRFAFPVDFVPPASPGESSCPCCRHSSGNRARWPLSVAVIATTGTVQAVGSAVTGAVTAVTRGRDPCAGRDRLRACQCSGSSDCSGRSFPAGPPGHPAGPPPLAAPEPLAYETLACATKVAIAPDGTSSLCCPAFCPVAMHVVSVVLLWPVGPLCPP